MNIAIIGNGPDINKIENWEKELADKDIIIRIKRGGPKKIYNESLFTNKKHFLFLREFYNILQLDSNDIDYILKYYEPIIYNTNSDNIESIKRALKKLKCNDESFLRIVKSFEAVKNKKIINAERQIDTLLIDLKEKYLPDPLTFSTGAVAILYFRTLYEDANIFLYGFNFDHNLGWFWDTNHKHGEMHDFKIEKKILFENYNIKNVIIV